MKRISANWQRALVTFCGVALAAGFFAFRAQADQWDKMTILTVNQPIQVRDTLLQPGQYVFKLMDSPSNRHIVQIFNSDRSQVIDTILAIPNYRLEPTGDSRFAFWETPPGAARALRAWFYPGDNFGQEFTYPKHLAMLNLASSTTVVAPPAPPPPPAAEPAPPAVVETQPETAPAPQPSIQQEPAPPPPPVEIAQNNEPKPSAQEPAPESAPSLPKTATAYPVIGLGGLLALAFFGLLRVKRLA